MDGLAQAKEHIAEQEKKVSNLIEQNEHHEKQRMLGSELILDLQVKIKGLENDRDVAYAVNKTLQAQLEDLKAENALLDAGDAEQEAGLRAAENHRAGLEEQISLLTSTVSDLEVKNSSLRNDMRDLKHQPAYEERTPA